MKNSNKEKGSVLIKAVEILSKPLLKTEYKNCNLCNRKLSSRMRERRHLKLNRKYIYVCKYGCVNEKQI